MKEQPTNQGVVRNKWLKGILVLTAVFLALENIILAFNNLQANTAVLGLRYDGQLLGLKDKKQIESLVQSQVAHQQKSLVFLYQNKKFVIAPSEIGASVDIPRTTNYLLLKGRQGNPWQRFVFQNRTLLGLENSAITGTISQTLLTLKIVQIQGDINKEALPLRPDFENDVTQTLPARDGVRVNTNKLTDIIADAIFNPPDKAFELPVMATFTTHKEDELMDIRKQFNSLSQLPMQISSGELVFTITYSDLKSMLTVLERPDPNDPKKLRLVLRIDDSKLNKKLGQFAQKVEEQTHAEFDDHDARVMLYSLFYSNSRKLTAVPTGRNLALNKVLGAETENGKKVVFLTFDDGPNSIYHPMILDILKANNIQATFFLVGQNAKNDSAIAKRTKSEGHVIGNHSNTHSFLPNLSSKSISGELETANNILKTINDADITLFRPPYGGINLSVKQYAQQLGMKLYLWDVDPRDWSEPETDELVRRVVSNTHPGSDILLHSNHLATVKALPKIIEQLRGQGYSFEKLQ